MQYLVGSTADEFDKAEAKKQAQLLGALGRQNVEHESHRGVTENRKSD